MKSFLIFLLLLCSTFLYYSCKDEPSSIGVDLIGSDLINVKIFDSQIDSTSQEYSFFKEVIPVGGATRLLLGKYQNTTTSQNITASTLLKFVFSFSDSLNEDIINNEINVQSAWIKLRNRYVIGDTLANLSFTAHKVNEFWSYVDFTVDSLPLDYDAEDISSNHTTDDTSYSFNITADLVNFWMKSSANDSINNIHGIYLFPDAGSGKVIGFEAFTTTSTQAARLYVVIEKPGVYVDTINGLIFADCSIVDGNLPTLPTGLMGIQSSVAVFSKLKFDLSTLPKNAVINNAELILTKDTLNSYYGSTYSNTLSAFYLITSDSAGSSVTLSANNDKYSGKITSFARAWYSGLDNFGILLRPGDRDDGLELFAIKASDYSVFSERPRLKITYTIRENL